MNNSDTNTVIGFITPTSPPSTPLDTLKALALRNIRQLECVIDQIAGGLDEPVDDILDLLDGIRQGQYLALGEHVHVGRDERLGELRLLHPDAYKYDDGSPVVERFESRYGTSIYYPRYDGDRAKALGRHLDWVQRVERDVNAETERCGCDDDEADR